MPPTTPSTETAVQAFNFAVEAYKADRPDMRRAISADLMKDLKKLDVVPRIQTSKPSYDSPKVEKKRTSEAL